MLPKNQFDACCYSVLTQHFDVFKKVRDELHVKPDNIWIMDESGDFLGPEMDRILILIAFAAVKSAGKN